MYVEHNKPNWDKLQAISVLTSDSPQLGPTLKKNPPTSHGLWRALGVQNKFKYLIYNIG